MLVAKETAVLDAGTATVKVLVPLSVKGICEADAIRIGRQLWLVTGWHCTESAARVWWPVRMIRIDTFDLSPMGDRLVLVAPIATRVFKGKGADSRDHDIRLAPRIPVNFGASIPAFGRLRRRAMAA